MSYSVNWVSKVVSIPTTDLTLVSGTRYSLTMSDFLAEVRRLEWAFTEGLWAPAIVDHTNTRTDFAGANYAPFDDMINGYTVEFTGVADRVDLLGSNNNLVDILIPTGVSIVPSNSAGLQIVETSSGTVLTPEEKAAFETMRKYHTNKMEIDSVTNRLKIYEDNGVDIAAEFELQDAAGNPSSTILFKRIPV